MRSFIVLFTSLAVLLSADIAVALPVGGAVDTVKGQLADKLHRRYDSPGTTASNIGNTDTSNTLNNVGNTNTANGAGNTHNSSIGNAILPLVVSKEY